VESGKVGKHSIIRHNNEYCREQTGKCLQGVWVSFFLDLILESWLEFGLRFGLIAER